ncbi:MAG: phosphatidylglycerol lysyltransferase domain-containing protein [Deltaproteobacteria bacterium]|nr:phosphatidylglycerol lysyltransferase domain-containing protein [Deltaproteobacteria bacterium]
MLGLLLKYGYVLLFFGIAVGGETLFSLALVAALFLSLRYLSRLAFFKDLTLADLHGLVPYLIGAMGLINLISALLPKAHPTLAAVESWLPLEVSQHSRPLMLFAGVALLQVMGGLQRRKEQAWYVATLSLGVSLVLHLTRGLDLHHSLVAGMLLAYLIYYRKRFYARSDPASLVLGLSTAPILLALVMFYGTLGLHHHHSHYLWEPGATAVSEAFRAGILIVDPHLEPLNPSAAHFLGSVEIAGWVARLYLLVLFLRPVILRKRQEAPAKTVQALFARESRHSLSTFALQDDKHHWLAVEGRALVAYSTRGAVAVSCGDPLVPKPLLENAIVAFSEYARRNSWVPCFYEVAEENLPVYQALGLRGIKIAEEALLGLPDFSLAGGKRASLRSMVHKISRTGLKVWRYDRKNHPDPRLDEQLEEISEEWLSDKHLSELGFTIGRFSLEALNEVHVFVCGTEEKIEAFTSWLPFRQEQAAVLDLMRRRRSAPSGTMDFLLANALLQLRESGVVTASLANAPLANVDRRHGPIEKGLALLFENMNSFYGYKNLFQFKNKFAPNWEGRYLVYPKGVELPRIAYALARVHSTGGFLNLLRRS